MTKKHINLLITLLSLIAIGINFIFYNSNPYVSLVIAVVLLFNLYFSLPKRTQKPSQTTNKEV
ncbi:hypothetical protein DW155_05655 [Lactococcus petauri]|uniref:Uncharacterized protein n=1 Tax=Lactococcus petauri TaxID=1940789 RepID=A0A252CFJ9_9LACT|nr:hypothetical protein [Lactococcus petauri]OUK05331.1 hypothetical protein BZZ03_01045 [Lactococcus petauri]RGB59835.1 hypothetical protein DW155_05655 [Lactococcus petauri]